MTPLRGPNAHCIFPMTRSATFGDTGEQAVLMAIPKHFVSILSVFRTSPFARSKTFPNHRTF